MFLKRVLLEFGDVVQRVGCLPCKRLTWVQYHAPHMVPGAPLGVVPEHRASSMHRALLTVVWKQTNQNNKKEIASYFVLAFWVTPSDAQGLLTSLHSWITTGGTWVIIWDAGIKPGLVMCKANTLPTVLSLRPKRLLLKLPNIQGVSINRIIKSGQLWQLIISANSLFFRACKIIIFLMYTDFWLPPPLS